MGSLTRRSYSGNDIFVEQFVTQAFGLSTNDLPVARPAAALLLTLVLITLPSGAVSG